MSGRFLIDTNVIVYAYDRSESEKQIIAFALLDKLITLGLGALSAQVLSEFFVAVTRRIRLPLTLEQAVVTINNLSLAIPVFAVTDNIVCEAVRGVKEHQLSLWDAQIWAAARLNQCGVVLSEDFSHDRVIEGVRFVNPFRPGFDLEGMVE